MSDHAQSFGEQRADVARLARVAARDPAALGELYDAHSRRLFGLLVRILNDRHQAEAVLQDVFEQVWTRAATYTPAVGSPAGWLLGIARSRAIDRRRAGDDAGRPRSDEAAAEPVPADTAESEPAMAARQRDVQRALNALPSEQRELIEQAFFSGSTCSELAARFGLPIATVKARLRAGMLSLREDIGAGLIQR